MSKLDNIVCWGSGLILGGTSATLTDLAIQSSQKHSSLSRIALDLLTGVAVLAITTATSYYIRNKIFYEKRQTNIQEYHDGFQDGSQWDEEIIDKRTNSVVSNYHVCDAADRR